MSKDFGLNPPRYLRQRLFWESSHSNQLELVLILQQSREYPMITTRKILPSLILILLTRALSE